MRHLHVLLKLLDVSVGVCEALLQLGELLLLALADSVILLGLLALTESISVDVLSAIIQFSAQTLLVILPAAVVVTRSSVQVLATSSGISGI